ncbi:phosphoglycerol transferase MdoB-like AlkP superfamily enzyme [Mesobacillus stamsii]|uniref:Phosphoglycerol transferase MdoB-like AlkP superfamily enzyme n=1 Tax=Mesobacillus stamsii TaxID=225347 RepID=A0ABU0FZ71_9BACI|nr:phosphoglycerol transferase MdoB-like AlkP superfamily enzyme [Mesobacillus stamsii]
MRIMLFVSFLVVSTILYSRLFKNDIASISNNLLINGTLIGIGIISILGILFITIKKRKQFK